MRLISCFGVEKFFMDRLQKARALNNIGNWGAKLTVSDGTQYVGLNNIDHPMRKPER